MTGSAPLVTGCGHSSNSKDRCQPKTVPKSKQGKKDFQLVAKGSREPGVDQARQTRLLQVREQEKVTPLPPSLFWPVPAYVCVFVRGALCVWGVRA